MDTDQENGNFSEEKTGISIPQEWEKKRHQTMAIFLLNRFLMGLEFNMLASTLWSYVNHGLPNTDINLFYGLIASSRTVAGILFVPLAAKWYDTHRRMKLVTLLISSMVGFGYALYIMSFSPYLPVIGGLLYGCNFILTSIYNSEIHRVYIYDDIQQMFVSTLLVYGSGEILGPMIVKLLDRIDFFIGELHIVYGNIASFIMFFLNLARMLLAVFLTHDLSKEFDLKAADSGEGDVDVSKSLWLTAIKSLHLDTAYLLIRQLCTQFFTIYVGTALPVLITRTLQYKNFTLDLCLSAASIYMVLICFIMHRMRLSSRGVYICGIGSLVGIIVANITLFLISRSYGGLADALLLSILVFMYPFIWVLETVFMVTVFGKLSPSSLQSCLEGFRMTIYLIAFSAGSLLCVYVYDYIIVSFPMVCLITVILLTVMIIRRRVLMDPQPPIPTNAKGAKYSLLNTDLKVDQVSTEDE